MPLSPGTRFGHDKVIALLGEGGMGRVWQATDTRFTRQFSLRVLPDAFADDPDRLARSGVAGRGGWAGRAVLEAIRLEPEDQEVRIQLALI